MEDAPPNRRPGPPLGQLEKRLIHCLSGDLGPSGRPYLELARKLGISEELVLGMIGDFQERGILRRLGAVVVHQRSGFKANAMVVLEVPEDSLDEAGQALAGLPCVSHCYQRPPVEGWPYNLYAMVHAQSGAELSALISDMASLVGPTRWRVLESVRELKKTSLDYFHDHG
ncbi:MAG: Lrp/AsnC family transcriptional regulator [Deltaproteobacteria bacterium]|nr:Lrp/AsnC family transcriptional regulator [Deltaproteobacteria bacterium]